MNRKMAVMAKKGEENKAKKMASKTENSKAAAASAKKHLAKQRRIAAKIKQNIRRASGGISKKRNQRLASLWRASGYRHRLIYNINGGVIGGGGQAAKKIAAYR
jgi:hypothetical protein